MDKTTFKSTAPEVPDADINTWIQRHVMTKYLAEHIQANHADAIKVWIQPVRLKSHLASRSQQVSSLRSWESPVQSAATSSTHCRVTCPVHYSEVFATSE